MIEVTQPPRHSSLPDVTPDEHHNKSHAHDGADGSGTVAYSSLSGAPSVPAFATPSVALGTAASAGVANTVIRSDCTVAAFDASAPTTSATGDVAAVGSVAFAARRDHVHGREFGDVRTISANLTLPADNSWTPVDYFEVAANVVVEITNDTGLIEVMV